jgi:hypothetical protein
MRTSVQVDAETIDQARYKALAHARSGDADWKYNGIMELDEDDAYDVVSIEDITPAPAPDHPFRYRVDVWEYERGWGSKLDSQVDFVTKEDAYKYMWSVNKDNTAKEVPDYYVTAREPRLIDLTIDGEPK